MELDVAIRKFIEDLKHKNRSKGTIKEYQKDLEMFSNYLLQKGKCPIEQIQRSHMASYLDFLVKERAYRISSRNRQMNTLRSFFKYCKASGVIESNYAEQLERLQEEKVERVYLTSQEVNELVEAIEHPLIKLVIITLFFTGTRISECLKLEINDIDFLHKTISIKNGKGNKYRRIPLNPELEKVLKKYIEVWRVRSNAKNLFLTERSGSLSDVYVNRVLKETAKRLNWEKKVTCHALRHSFASALVQKNVHIVVIKELLGHESLRTTSGYVHIQGEDLEEAIQKLAL